MKLLLPEGLCQETLVREHCGGSGWMSGADDGDIKQDFFFSCFILAFFLV